MLANVGVIHVVRNSLRFRQNHIRTFRQQEGAPDGQGFDGVVIVLFREDIQQDGINVRAGAVGHLVYSFIKRVVNGSNI